MSQLYLSACALLLGVVVVLSAATHTYFQISKRGVEIYKNDDIWKCDQIACPANTYLCEVSKTIVNKTMILRRNTCYDSKENILLEQISTKTVKNPQNETIMLEVYRNGVIATSQRAGIDSPNMEFDISLKQHNVDESLTMDEDVVEVNEIMNSAVKKFIANTSLNNT